MQTTWVSAPSSQRLQLLQMTQGREAGGLGNGDPDLRRRHWGTAALTSVKAAA